MPLENEYQSEENGPESVQNRSWRDGRGSNTPPPTGNGVIPPNDVAPVKEKIPKMTEEERIAQENWQNSEEMRQGLRDMLPKGDSEPKSDVPMINLDEIRAQATGQEANNPLQALIVNFYTQIHLQNKSDYECL